MTVSLIDINHEWARRKHLDFIGHCWQRQDPFIIGHHTDKICGNVDNAIERYKNGESVFLIIKVPFRHGKSDIISRYLPPHYLGMFPDNEVLLATYAGDFANTLSRFSRNILRSDEYKQLYDLQISSESGAVQTWGIEGHTGNTNWVGIGGAITGRGYDLGIIDDYLKNREQAESQLTRDKQWEWLRHVFLTRRAPVSITIVLATPWHIDDLIGRIESEMKKNEEFPKFEVVTFPALDDSYETGTLFPERFSQKWYSSQKAALGSYGTASLLQCDPVPKGGNLLKTDRIVFEDEFPELKFMRVWDLASSTKEKLKSDPDYTVGTLIAIDYQDSIPHLYIKHMLRGQWEAPERDRRIIAQSEVDGDSVSIGIEAIAGYKDTYTHVQELLSGIRSVEAITPSKDKIIRAAPVEPIFEAGNVHVLKGEWNQPLIDECSAFPSGKHDDIVDTITNGYHALKNDMDFSELPKVEAVRRT